MASTPAEYIQHHLQNLTYGKLPAGYERADGSVLDQATWTIAQTGLEARDMGFMAVHLDTLGWSLLMGHCSSCYSAAPPRPLPPAYRASCRISSRCAWNSSKAWSRTPFTAAIR